MVRLVLVLVLVLLAAAGGIAVALNHYFGWKGLLAFPVLLIALVWVGKSLLGWVFKRFLLGLVGMKSGVLRGATMTVHSILPIAKPPEPAADEDAEDSQTEKQEEADKEEPESEQEEEEEPRVYYEIDVTITPRDANRAWEPTEFILASGPVTSLDDLEENEVGATEDCLIWNGSVFAEDGVGKHPGEQRLKLTVSVKPGTREAWLHYYQEKIGRLELPEWRLSTTSRQV